MVIQLSTHPTVKWMDSFNTKSMAFLPLWLIHLQIAEINFFHIKLSSSTIQNNSSPPSPLRLWHTPSLFFVLPLQLKQRQMIHPYCRQWKICVSFPGIITHWAKILAAVILISRELNWLYLVSPTEWRRMSWFTSWILRIIS